MVRAFFLQTLGPNDFVGFRKTPKMAINSAHVERKGRARLATPEALLFGETPYSCGSRNADDSPDFPASA